MDDRPTLELRPVRRAEPEEPRGGPWLPPPDDLVGRRAGRRFLLGEARGAGGLATVYRALDERTGEVVAVKVLHQTYAGMAPLRARFAREVALAKRLGAELGAAGLASGVVQGRPYLALSYLEGPTLRQRVVEGGVVTPATAAALGVALCRRLARLHGAGLVHNDIKPANVLADGGALLDLGSVLPRGATLESIGGSSAYGAPERWIDGAVADPRGDVFAVGALLFEALCGRRPIEAHPAQPVIERAVLEAPPLRTLRPGVDAALAQAIDRALATEPAARFAGADALLAALAAAGAPDPHGAQEVR